MWTLLKNIGVCVLVGVCIGLIAESVKAPHRKRLIATFKVQQLFDHQYYRTTYSDSVRFGVSPFITYILKGNRELQNPSQDFDACFYYRAYMRYDRTVVEGLSPLAHWGQNPANITHLKFLKKVVPLKNPKYYLTLAAIFRNEERFLKEWIEYYRMMGVEHFYLTNHLSTDGYMEVLKPYMEKGLVTLRHETREMKDADFKSKSFYIPQQIAAYQWAVDETKDKAEWLIICDVDEFIVPYKAKTLCEALKGSKSSKGYDRFPAIALYWKFFGTSGVESLGEGELLIDKMRQCMSDEKERVPLNIKTIMKPRYVKRAGVHCSVLKKGYLMVNSVQDYVPTLPHVCFSPAGNRMRVHHYQLRDKRFVRESRKMRYVKGSQKIREAERYMLEVLDPYYCEEVCDVMERFVPQLRKRMGFKSEA